MAAWSGWGIALLRRLGYAPTRSNLQFLNAWQRAEGGGASFNPLNTTQPMPGASSYNPVGVRNYASPQAGLQATIKTLRGNQGYAPILQGLASGNMAPASLAQRVMANPWGTHSFPTLSMKGDASLAAPMSAAGPAAGPAAPLLPRGNGALQIARGQRPVTVPMPMLQAPPAPNVMPFVNSMISAMRAGDPQQRLQGTTAALGQMSAGTSSYIAQLREAIAQRETSYKTALADAKARAAQTTLPFPQPATAPDGGVITSPSKQQMTPIKGALAEAFYDPIGQWDNGRFSTQGIGNHSDHVHFSITNPQAMLSAIATAQKMGLRVGENPYIGDVNPVHVKGSFHYRDFPGDYNGKRLGQAIDVSGDPRLMAQFFRWGLHNLR